MNKEVGYKADENKPRLDLVLGEFANALWEVGKVGTYGANKYTDSGWLQVDNALERYSSAMLRHYLQYKTGDDIDESTFHHLAHVAWNALAVLELYLRESNRCTTWKDYIADFYECNQGLYNLEPVAINKEADEKVRDAIASYFANTYEEDKKIDG